MSKYRRIEINAYHRRVTVVSGESTWEASHLAETQAHDEVLVHATDLGNSVEPDSPEGQLIPVEALASFGLALNEGSSRGD